MDRGEATRRRILDAATAEFATYGIAGARVERIALAARANKAQLYTYFGSKDGLFDAVMDEHNDMIVEAVPLDGHDLVGYATGLYDAYLERPELVRLATWARLERNPTGNLFGTGRGRDTPKLRAIAAAQRSGHIDSTTTPADVLSLVTALSLTWSPASPLITATKSDKDTAHQRRRQALAETVRRAFAPQSERQPELPGKVDPP